MLNGNILNILIFLFIFWYRNWNVHSDDLNVFYVYLHIKLLRKLLWADAYFSNYVLYLDAWLIIFRTLVRNVLLEIFLSIEAFSILDLLLFEYLFFSLDFSRREFLNWSWCTNNLREENVSLKNLLAWWSLASRFFLSWLHNHLSDSSWEHNLHVFVFKDNFRFFKKLTLDLSMVWFLIVWRGIDPSIVF